MTIGTTVDSSAPPQNSSVRTIILGIDHSGRIVQHDRTAPAVLARPADKLLGATLSDLLTEVGATDQRAGKTAGKSGNNGTVAASAGARSATAAGSPASASETVATLLEAIRSDREGTGMLPIQTGAGEPDAIVTVHPMRAGDANLAALALLRIAAAGAERFVDPALMRHALLDGTFKRIGDTLDFDQLARELMNIAGTALLQLGRHAVLESLSARRSCPRRPGRHPPAAPAGGGHRRRTIRPGTPRSRPARSCATRRARRTRECMASGKPVLESPSTKDEAADLADVVAAPAGRRAAGRRLDAAAAAGRAGRHAGLLRLHPKDRLPRRSTRTTPRSAWSSPSRAAMFIDNARRYNREHATALTLQRSLLPTGLSAPSSVEVRHRYLPGSKLIEVGGDWYESIALPGARVALVVGDVAGHGVRAAVTMGRLRTAIQTLAMLELPPAESLQQLDELMHDARRARAALRHLRLRRLRRGDRHAARWPRPGTCRRCWSGPDGSNEFLDVTPRRRWASATARSRASSFTVEDGSLLVLYTDGLVENRDPGHRRGPAAAAEDLRPRRRRPGRWRTCARRRWTACTPTISATTSRC